jgi:hypothetical protein
MRNHETPDRAPQSVATLRRIWEQAHGTPPPLGLGRKLLARGISWKEQGQRHGGLAPALKRELARLAEQLERSCDLDVERQLSLKTGTRLAREWQGRTCRVAVLEQGFLFEDRRYASSPRSA